MKSKLIVLLLLSTMMVHAQQITQIIKGKVIDEGSQSPLPFVTVVVKNSNPLISTTTDEAGNFRLPPIAVGRYDIEASCVGYEVALTREVMLSSGKEAFLTIRMNEKLESLKEVVITNKANKESALNTMAAVSARMFSVDEARRYAGGVDDPARLASAFAGVTSKVGNNGIVIRGNAPKAILWRLEGVEISNPNHFADLRGFGSGGLTALSSMMLANSDFFTGAFPAEYGNALSGVFDLNLRTGNEEKYEHVLQFGLIGLDVSSEGPILKGKRSSYLFNYRYSTLSLLTPLLPDDAAGTKYQDLSFKFFFPTKKCGNFSLWGMGLKDESGQLAETDSALWVYNQDKEESLAYQYMGAMGIDNKMFFGKNTFLKTTMALTANGLDYTVKGMTPQVQLVDDNSIRNSTWNYVITSYINHKFSARHTNKTGVIATVMNYDMLYKQAPVRGVVPITLVDEQGQTSLLSAYSTSLLRISENLTATAGIHAQYFVLNENSTLEPRVGLRYQLSDQHSVGVGYGLHSRLERVNFYFARLQTAEGEVFPNKQLDFSKSQHLVLSYDYKINETVHVKAEPFFMNLYNIPMIKGSTFSFINLEDNWFMNDSLVNNGKGRNYGLDITLERFLEKGYYYLFTASLFRSEFENDDAIWRHTKFDRMFAFNLLGGKEWKIGKAKQHMLDINLRMTLQGGDFETPVDEASSILLKQIIYDEQKAYSVQQLPAFTMHATIGFRINKPRYTSIWEVKAINLTGTKEMYGYRYNFKQNTIEKNSEVLMVPWISYRIEF